MALREFAALFCMGLMLAMPGSAQEPPDRLLRGAVGRAAETAVEETEDTSDPIEKRIRALSLSQRIAQLMVVTLDGNFSPDNSDRRLLTSLTPGGVVIPRASSPSAAVTFVAALRALQKSVQPEIPLLIGTNIYSLTQHGGLPEKAFVQLPSMMSLAAAGDTKATDALAALIAHQMDVLGFDFHMGPSLVLASTLSEAGGRIQNFGADPERTAQVSGTLFGALKSAGIIAVPMGFPGGGANRVDQSPAVLLTPKAQLIREDVFPYMTAIADGLRMLHVGNTLVPTLDEEVRPASLSPKVIREYLKGELGFKGIVLAGPIDSRDIVDETKPSTAAREALLAGADMLYWSRSTNLALRAIYDLTKDVEAERLDEKVIEDALRRVLAMKTELNLLEKKPPEESAARKLETELKKVDESYQVERRAISLVQNRGAILPLTSEQSMPIVVTGVAGVEALRNGLLDYIKSVRAQPITSAKHARRVQEFEIDRLTRYARGIKTAVCVLSNEMHPNGQVRLIRKLKQMGAKVVVVLLGYPSILPLLTDADAIVLAYSSMETLDQTMRAVADILVGNAPVDILPEVRDMHHGVATDMTFSALDVIRSPIGRLPVDMGAPFERGFSVQYRPVLSMKKVAWDFGDGKSGSGMEVVHAYSEPGRYPVTLTVTDSMGEDSAGTFHIVIE